MSAKLKFTLKAWPAIFLIAVTLSYLTEWGAKWLFGIELPEQTQVETVKAMFRNGPWTIIALNLIIVLVAMPALEELLFRWVTRFHKVLWPVTSALFAAAHYIQADFPDNAFIALFAFGLCQCWLYRRTGALWCAMLNHSLFNLTNVVLLLAFM